MSEDIREEIKEATKKLNELKVQLSEIEKEESRNE